MIFLFLFFLKAGDLENSVSLLEKSIKNQNLKIYFATQNIVNADTLAFHKEDCYQKSYVMENSVFKNGLFYPAIEVRKDNDFIVENDPTLGRVYKPNVNKNFEIALSQETSVQQEISLKMYELTNEMVKRTQEIAKL